MSFEEELRNAKNPWIIRIGQYLQSRDDLKDNLKKENKSLQECFDYILVELSKKSVKDGGVGYAAGDDEELYALAVHYYDEDDIKVEKKSFTTNADGSADAGKLVKNKSRANNNVEVKKSKDNELNQEAINKAVSAALEQYKKDEKEAEKKKKAEAKAKKEATKLAKQKADENQLSLFDLG